MFKPQVIVRLSMAIVTVAVGVMNFSTPHDVNADDPSPLKIKATAKKPGFVVRHAVDTAEVRDEAEPDQVDADSNAGRVTPTGRKIPEIRNAPAIQDDGEVPSEKKLPSRKPQSLSPRPDPMENDANPDDEPMPESRRTRKPPRSMLLPTNWEKSTRLIPTDIDAEVQGVELTEQEAEAVVHITAAAQQERKNRQARMRRNGTSSGSPEKALRQIPLKGTEWERNSESQPLDPLLGAFLSPVMTKNTAMGVNSFNTAMKSQVPTSPKSHVAPASKIPDVKLEVVPSTSEDQVPESKPKVKQAIKTGNPKRRTPAVPVDDFRE